MTRRRGGYFSSGVSRCVKRDRRSKVEERSRVLVATERGLSRLDALDNAPEKLGTQMPCVGNTTVVGGRKCCKP